MKTARRSSPPPSLTEKILVEVLHEVLVIESEDICRRLAALDEIIDRLEKILPERKGARRVQTFEVP